MTNRIKVVHQYNSVGKRYGGSSEELNVYFYNSKIGLKLKHIRYTSAFGSTSSATLETITLDEIEELEKARPKNDLSVSGKRSYYNRVEITTMEFEEFEDLIARLESMEGIKTGTISGSHLLRDINFEYVDVNIRADVDLIARAYFSVEESLFYFSA